MATVRLLILSVVLALICAEVRADSAIVDEVAVSDVSDSALKIEVEQLKSRISVLESNIEDKTRDVKSKDESIAQLEKVIQEKADGIASLQSEIDSLQKKGTVDAAEQVGKAHARARDLEKQAEKLRKEIEAQTLKKNALEARLYEAENKIQDLNSKLQNLQKVNDEQKSRIRKTERALLVAEEEMMKAKLEATSRNKELLVVHGAWLPPWFATHLAQCQSFIVSNWKEHGKPALDVTVQRVLEKKGQAQKWAETHWETVKSVHGAWLPPWFATHLAQCQSFIVSNWKEHGKPALDVTVQKVLEKKGQAQKWAETHRATVKSKWIPTVKEQWVTFTTNMEPHVQVLTTKTVEVYELSKSSLTPHVNKVQELTDPYYQEAKKFTKPYIDHVATVTKPHVDKARVALKPHTEKAVHVCREFLKSATTYHHQVQATVQETLNKHELTRTLATKELVWFAASALLALPIFLLRLSSAVFCKKAKKPVRNAHSNHARRRAKRGHPDK